MEIEFHISQYIRLQGGNLLMRHTDGRVEWVPLTSLKTTDQFLVRRRHEKEMNRRNRNHPGPAN